ncbi:MAG: hypothetical protein GF329_20405 [Candidatus Lokiarchaeota archaeon]|nr:hypothetical protein [Candidatus Lokiarchaeota archaeon]
MTIVQNQALFPIVKDLSKKLGTSLGVRVYVAITDANGKIVYIDEALKKFVNLITTFVEYNFDLLKIGDHSIPLSSSNLIFVKTSNRALIVLYTKKGLVGQLLSFKKYIGDFFKPIDEIMKNEGAPSGSTQAPEPPVRPAPTEQVEEQPPEIILEKRVYQRKKYEKIKPILKKKISSNLKLKLEESAILNFCSEGKTVSEMIELSENITLPSIKRVLFKFTESKWIKIPGYSLVSYKCDECKSQEYTIIPDDAFKYTKSKQVRKQVSGACGHDNILFINKKLKAPSIFIERILPMVESVDFNELTIKSLIQILGQDIFLNIFHGLLFDHNVVLLDAEEYIDDIANLYNHIFSNIGYDQNITSIARQNYQSNYKKYKDFLVIDFDERLVLNEPYEEDKEEFGYERNLFEKIFAEEQDENRQILKAYQEFERVLLLTEELIEFVDKFKEITEFEVIDIFEKNKNIEITREDIHICKKLAEIYYDNDILNKKIKKAVTEKVDDFFSSI